MKIDNKILNKIEIPLREGKYVFEKTSYRDEALSGILEKVEFDLILDEAGKIMADSINKKRENDEIKLPKFIVYMTTLCILLSVVYTILLLIASNIEAASSSSLIVSAVLCLFGAIFISFGLSIYNFCRRVREFKALEVFIKEDLDYFFDTINSKYYGVLEFVFVPNRNIVYLNIFKRSNLMEENMDLTERRSLKGNTDTRRVHQDETDMRSQIIEKSMDKSTGYLRNYELSTLTGKR
jgi:hypothetical protein